ncbi:hypothetical protein J6TS7_32460 [Paenibacillus dendritiformis]|uniref:conjugal transfer protein TrbL family protein n=1 Tax=Paenibacillus TaxID=44249 RepID=UPI001B16B5BD|nr:conjugal transfer protein TrbL family protein [Paenibacillus dendritiformis]GIO79636.1 hypothetical protein J6TS7_32460 [Paenibacillus dendritiformis]
MRKWRWIASISFVLLFTILSSPVAHADIFENITQNLIIKPIKEFLASLLNVAISGIMERIAKPTDLYAVSIVRESISAAEYIGWSLLCLNTIKELIKSMYDQGFGEGGKTVVQIVLQAIKGAAFVALTPWILEQFLEWNNRLVQVISVIGGDTTLTKLMGLVEGDSKLSFGDFILMAFIILIFAVGLIILAILATFRYAQLIVLAILGPILASSAVNKSEGLNTWFRESIATVFTQSLQYILLYIMVDFLVAAMKSGGASLFNQDLFWHLGGAIGFLIIIITGPSSIKKYLHSSGAGGAAGGAAKMAAYRFMARSSVSK